MKYSSNLGPSGIPNPKNKKKYKNNRKVSTSNKSSLQGINNILHCDISGKITLQAEQQKTFNGIGSLKLSWSQNGNNLGHELQV